MLNSAHNGAELTSDKFLTFIDEWPESDHVFVQVPKSLDLLEMILSKLQSQENVQVHLGVMIKHMHNTFYKTINKYFLDIESSKIVKKARIVSISKPINKFRYSQMCSFNFNDLEFNNYKSIFSSSNADEGSAFLLGNIELIKSGSRVLDIGCGNGLLAIFISKKFDSMEIIGYDDSLLAVDSAKLNAEQNGLEKYRFFQSSDAEEVKDVKFDVIVCNPPFHLNHSITESIAVEMIHVASKRLSENGVFYLVCNRHLNYRKKLRFYFDEVAVIAENSKFRVFKSNLAGF